MPNWLSDGPIARSITFFVPVPPTIKPLIATCSSRPTCSRVETLSRLGRMSALRA